MADLSITPVATQIRPVPQMSLGEMVNLAQNLQAYQQAQQLNPIQVQLAQQQLSRLEQLTPEEVARARAEAQVAQQTVKPRVGTAMAQEQTAVAQSQQAQLQTLGAFLRNARSEAADLLKQSEITYDDIANRYKSTLDKTDAPSEIKDKALAQGLLGLPKNLDTNQYRAWLANSLVKTVSDENRLSTLFPSMQLTATGAAIVPVTAGGALAVSPPGQVMPGGVQTELPPTTPVTDPRTGQQTYLGPLSQRGAAGQLTAAVGPQQAAVLAGAGGVAAKDWETTSAEAVQSQPRIAVFQKIRELAPQAFVGVGAERKKFLSGLAQAIGIPVNVLETAKTEEIAKNSALLQLAGNNTDAARAIAELANPNTKMSLEGINRVTNQLISVEKLKAAKARFLQPYVNDAQAYQSKAAEFADLADPRLFQEATPADVASMKASMSKAEQAEFARKVRRARELGLI